MAEVNVRRYNGRGALVFTAILIVATILTICLSRKFYAILFSAVLLVFIVATFTLFCLSMLRSVRQRRSAAIVLLIVANIGTMISLFANLYRWVGLKYPSDMGHEPHSFWDPLYFSVVTWTTLGYGDITPKPSARAIVEVEALAGYVVMALLIGVVAAMMQRD